MRNIKFERVNLVDDDSSCGDTFYHHFGSSSHTFTNFTRFGQGKLACWAVWGAHTSTHKSTYFTHRNTCDTSLLSVSERAHSDNRFFFVKLPLKHRIVVGYDNEKLSPRRSNTHTQHRDFSLSFSLDFSSCVDSIEIHWTQKSVCH